MISKGSTNMNENKIIFLSRVLDQSVDIHQIMGL